MLKNNFPNCHKFKPTKEKAVNIFTFSHRFYYTSIMLLTVLSLNISALTNYVWSKGTHTPPYTNWTTAATNIQAAVDEANNGDVVLVTNGTYIISSSISISKGVKVTALNGTSETVVDGNSPITTNRCFYINHADAVLEGFTITKGKAWNNKGGGVRIGPLGGTVQKCVITDNSAVSGGGGYAYNAGLFVSNTVFGNLASSGGGLFFEEGGTALYCWISGNHANDGGGVNFFHAGEVRNCTIVSNTAIFGGGVRLFAGGLLRNSVVRNNSASLHGGGVYTKYAGDVESCTVIANSAISAGGIYSGGGIVLNTISYFNEAPDQPDCRLTTNATCSYTCTTPLIAGAGNISNAPEFIQVDAGDYRLLTNSPCFNSGVNQPWMTGATDFAGVPRIMYGRVDIGAYEYKIPTSAVIRVSATVLDFDVYELFTEGTVTVSVENVGVGELTGGVAGVLAPFSVASGSPYAIDEGANTNLIFSFTPTVKGVFSNTVTLTGGGDVNVLLTGYGCDLATRYVSLFGAHISPFTNWHGAATNLQAAIDVAELADTVLITNNKYFLSEQIVVNKRITVRSVNGAESTFFVGQFPSITNRGFYVDHADAVIEGLTIRNCGGVSKGGGVYFNKNGTVKNCIIIYNLASTLGGGVYCNESGILISNSINKNISFDNGGGLFLFKGGVANYCNIGYNRSSHNGGGVAYNSSGKLTECVIVSNSSSWGGGVHLYKGGTIQNCEILTNLATQGGGGVHLNTYGIVENCVISENLALGARGGGVHTENGGTVRNSAIINNRSGVDSGGIHCHANGMFDNCIITGNVAGAVAGGVYFYLGGTAIYCRISENIAGTFGGGVYSRSGGAVRYSSILNNKAVNNGGGIFISGYGHLQNSLVAGNSSDAIGGGMYLRNGANVDSCTVAGNFALGSGGGVVCFSNSMVRNTVSYFNSASGSPDYLSTGAGCTSLYVCTSILIAG